MKMSNFIGQEKAKNMVELMLQNINENTLIPNILLVGSPGVGKTTFAKAIYAEAKKINNNVKFYPIEVTEATVNSLRNTIIKSCAHPSIFFLDEIHVNTSIIECLYEPIDNRTISFNKYGIMYVAELPPITFICATTEPGKIPQALQSRLVHIKFEPYSIEEMAALILQKKQTKGRITEAAAFELARRSLCNPRKTVQNYRKMMLWCNAKGIYSIEKEHVIEAMKEWGINELGLNNIEMQYIIHLYNAEQPQGIANISSALGLDQKYVEKIIEPPLVEQRFVVKTRAGRILSPQYTELIAKMEAQ